MEPKQLVEIADLEDRDYCVLLTSCIDCVILILRQGLNLDFDRFEARVSTDDTMFIYLLFLVSKRNEDLKQIISKVDPENLRMMAPSIERDIESLAASMTAQAIVANIGDELFCILVDDYFDGSDVYVVVGLRYVDKKGSVIERFLGMILDDNSVSSLKAGIESLFAMHQLGISKLCWQGYNGASNCMKISRGLKI